MKKLLLGIGGIAAVAAPVAAVIAVGSNDGDKTTPKTHHLQDILIYKKYFIAAVNGTKLYEFRKSSKCIPNGEKRFIDAKNGDILGYGYMTKIKKLNHFPPNTDVASIQFVNQNYIAKGIPFDIFKLSNMRKARKEK